MEPPPFALLPPELPPNFDRLLALLLMSGCGTAASLRGRGLLVIFMAASALAGISCTVPAEVFFVLVVVMVAVPFSNVVAVALSGSSPDVLPLTAAEIVVVAADAVVGDSTDGSCGGQTRSQSGCMVDVITSGNVCTTALPPLLPLLRTVPVFSALIRRSSSCSTSSSRSAAALRAADELLLRVFAEPTALWPTANVDGGDAGVPGVPLLLRALLCPLVMVEVAEDFLLGAEDGGEDDDDVRGTVLLLPFGLLGLRPPFHVG